MASSHFRTRVGGRVWTEKFLNGVVLIPSGPLLNIAVSVSFFARTWVNRIHWIPVNHKLLGEY